MMKTKELSRQVRDYIVKKLKASFGIKEYLTELCSMERVQPQDMEI